MATDCPLPVPKRNIEDDWQGSELCVAAANETEVTTWETSVMPLTANTDGDAWTSFFTTMGSFTGSSIPSPTGWVTTVTGVSAVSSQGTIFTVSDGLTESVVATVPSAATTTLITATSASTFNPVLTTPSWTLTLGTTVTVSIAPTASSRASRSVTSPTLTTADWTLTLGATVTASHAGEATVTDSAVATAFVTVITGEETITAIPVATAIVTVSTVIWVEPSTTAEAAPPIQITASKPFATTVVSCDEVGESQGKVNLWC